MPGGSGRRWNQIRSRASSSNYSDGKIIRKVNLTGHDDPYRKFRGLQRKVSFKPSLVIQEKLMGIAKAALDGDEDMEIHNKSRFDNETKYRRKGSPIPRGKLGKKLGPGAFGWYEVFLPYGGKYEKDMVIRSILEKMSPDIFIPHYWKAENNTVTFYVDEGKSASRLSQLDRTIQMPDGFSLKIRVRSGLPPVLVDDNLKERMKQVMAKRYNATTKALDLSKFHHDPELKDVFCALFRPMVMKAALDIIGEHIPDLEALNLNSNSINNMDHLNDIHTKIPNLKILYLDNNRIHVISSLHVFKHLPIIELNVKQNPFRIKYRQERIYISEIRKRFPKLIKLDGQELEPLIHFDIADPTNLPPAKASFLCDSSGENLIRQFLEQYFTIFDSDSRQPLLDAYHEHAMISLSVSPISQSGKIPTFASYSRNLLRCHDKEEKSRLMRFGRLPCVSFLSELPKTRHDPQSFSVDLMFFTPKLIAFTVAGIFKDVSVSSELENAQLRYFQRQFVIVPSGSGFCIRNELIFVTNTTPAQNKIAFKPRSAQPPQSQQNAPTTSIQARLNAAQPSTSHLQPGMSTNIASTSNPSVLDETTKLRMIQALSGQSNMNLEWSKKCLEETNWDYNHALYAFEQLNKGNKIPPEAFIK